MSDQGHGVEDHIGTSAASGARADHVYVRRVRPSRTEKRPKGYIGQSQSSKGNRATSGITESPEVEDFFDEVPGGVSWPEIFRVQLPTPCREDLAVGEYLLIERARRDQGFGLLPRNQQSSCQSSGVGAVIWLRRAPGELRVTEPSDPQGWELRVTEPSDPQGWELRVTEPSDPQDWEQLNFCHQENRDLFLDAGRMNLEDFAPFFPYGQLSKHGPITLAELSSELNASQLVVVHVTFADLGDRSSMRGTKDDLKERACRYWPWQRTKCAPKIGLPNGKDGEKQFLIAVAPMRNAVGETVKKVIVGIWLIHCHRDDVRREFGLDEANGITPQFAGRWVGGDDVSDDCAKHLGNQNAGPCYFSRQDCTGPASCDESTEGAR